MPSGCKQTFVLIHWNKLRSKELRKTANEVPYEGIEKEEKMATNARTTTGSASSTGSTAQRTHHHSDTTQVREGVTKARHGATAIVRNGAERAVDVPVGAVLTVRDRVTEVVEPWTTGSSREKELKSLRTQVTRELSKFERRGGQARRKANRRVRSSRTRMEREVKARRREVEKAVRANRARVEKAVKDNRVKLEEQLKKAQTVVTDRASTPA